MLYSLRRRSKSVTSARLKDAHSQLLADTVSHSRRYVCNSLTSPPALDLELTRKPIGDLIPQYWVSNRLLFHRLEVTQLQAVEIRARRGRWRMCESKSRKRQNERTKKQHKRNDNNKVNWQSVECGRDSVVVFCAWFARWDGRKNCVFCVATDEHVAEGREPHREVGRTIMVGNRVLRNR